MALTRGIWSNDYFAVSSLICMVMAIGRVLNSNIR